MKDLRTRVFCTILLPTILLASCGSSPQINQGVTHYNQGQYNQAAAMWNEPAKQGDYTAQYNLGLLWKDGLGSTPKNLNEAANWFYLSANQGFVPAMVRLAEVQFALGNQTPAISWLNLAARWGNNEAIQSLRVKGLPVPQADLLAAQQHNETQALIGLINSVGNLTTGGNSTGGSSYQPSNSTYSGGTVQSAKSCTSDYSCGYGNKCVKAQYSAAGVCMRTVNKYGIQQINKPERDSWKINQSKQCNFDTQCPIGFRCDQNLNACIKK